MLKQAKNARVLNVQLCYQHGNHEKELKPLAIAFTKYVANFCRFRKYLKYNDTHTDRDKIDRLQTD